MPSFPPVPPEVKGIAHFLKVADEHDGRNVVVSYWSRMYACQAAMKIVPGKKSPEVSSLLIAIMDWLEQTKKENHDADGITDEVAAQAIIEEYAIQLFTYADAQDKAENFNKNTIKAFYTAGILMDILQQFGELSEDVLNKRKYAKWKAAYIHNCLKVGDKPMPGPPTDSNADDNLIHKSLVEGYTPEANDAGSPSDSVTPGNPPSDSVAPVNPPSAPSTPAAMPSPSQVNWPQFPTEPASQMPVTPQPSVPLLPATSQDGANLTADQIEKAQKYCKWAASALTYDDVKTAVDNLHKALNLLQLGKE